MSVDTAKSNLIDRKGRVHMRGWKCLYHVIPRCELGRDIGWSYFKPGSVHTDFERTTDSVTCKACKRAPAPKPYLSERKTSED